MARVKRILDPKTGEIILVEFTPEEEAKADEVENRVTLPAAKVREDAEYPTQAQVFEALLAPSAAPLNALKGIVRRLETKHGASTPAVSP